MASGMVGYSIETERVNGTAIPGQPIYRAKEYQEGPPDHLSVGGVVNLIANDLRQLQEAIGELRARLSPILAEKSPPQDRSHGAPVLCKMAAELSDAHATIHVCRQLVDMTLMQLDL